MADKIEAWIEKDWRENGITWVLIVRERLAGSCELGAFLVDPWCLGVRDAYGDVLDRSACETMVGEQIPAEVRAPVDPAWARALVEGAVAYAQGLGFLPHRDFKKVRKVFGSTKPTQAARDLLFGREGRPCFVAGRADDEARVRRVLAILTARFGPEGFDFIDTIEVEEEEAVEDVQAEPFYLFIEEGRCPNKTLTSFEAEGFIVGLLLLPDAVPPETWVAAMWGGDEYMPVFRDAAEEKAVSEGLQAIFVRVARDLDEESFHIYLPPAEDVGHGAMAARFCTGVLRGLAMLPGVLERLRAHPDGAKLVALLEDGATVFAREVEVDLCELIDRSVRALGKLATRLRSSHGTSSG